MCSRTTSAGCLFASTIVGPPASISAAVILTLSEAEGGRTCVDGRRASRPTFLFGFAQDQDDVMRTVGANAGFRRAFVACSKANANLISVASACAPAKNDSPTGNPNACPAGTVMCG